MKFNILIIPTLIISMLTISFSLCFSINKDTLDYNDRVYAKNLKTVRMFPYDMEFSYPIISLYSETPLLFSFDQIESTPEDYYYTIIHCTHDWKPSNLMFFEYAEGFEENIIRDYNDSHSTFVQYTHYELQIPNDDISLIYSGNYLLVVYKKNGDKETIVCTKRFMIYEQLVEVQGRISASPDNLYRKTSQKVDFKISRQEYNIYDPETELKIAILQNYQWNNAILNVKPSFLDNQYFYYEWDEKTLFKASNEYRIFNLIETVITGENIENIEFKNPYYYATLNKDKSRLFSQYSTYTDFNGLYGIRTDRYKSKDYPEVQSDYAIVKFSLDYNMPLNNVDIYLYGELTNFELTDEYKLLYNMETRSYDKLLFLKQGFYNYRYITVTQDEKRIVDHTFFEGSFYDTENDYLILIYHRDPRKSYDQLISYTIFNSTQFR